MKKWEYKLIGLGKLVDTYAPWNEKIMRGNKEGIRTLTALNTYVFRREKK